jgi:hypothetical protein
MSQYTNWCASTQLANDESKMFEIFLFTENLPGVIYDNVGDNSDEISFSRAMRKAFSQSFFGQTYFKIFSYRFPAKERKTR